MYVIQCLLALSLFFRKMYYINSMCKTNIFFCNSAWHYKNMFCNTFLYDEKHCKKLCTALKKVIQYEYKVVKY
jgi:hypothetical protein